MILKTLSKELLHLKQMNKTLKAILKTHHETISNSELNEVSGFTKKQ